MNRFTRTVLTGVVLYFLAGRAPFLNGVLGWLALGWTGALYARGTPGATWMGAAAAGALAATLGVLANVFWLVAAAGLVPSAAVPNLYPAIGVDLLHLLVAPAVGAVCAVVGAGAGGRRSRWPWNRRLYRRPWRL